ncbi:MAG: UDP-N-acetylglucosamine 1-carboxyvinyltransferase [Ruminococcus sp.]|nr:UDP-N-acetylglucosamine 1-carboxyvinyltransferase [Ruminococcus sp.]
MQKLVIRGEKRLYGEIAVQGAKNSALALLAGCTLCSGEVRLTNCPALSDVFAACRILNRLGCKSRYCGHTAYVNAQSLSECAVPEDMMREMRSSIVFLGAILGRKGQCELSFPGGCELGPRPIDMHISALEQMGARISEEYGVLCCECPYGLHGARISLGFPSVGATENIMLAAVLAKGETVILNAAREPEITDLGSFLNCCGARISGHGTSTIVISGVEKLHGCEYEVMPDRIAAATYMAAAAVTGGELDLKNARAQDLEAVIPVFEQMGCAVFTYDERIYINCKRPLKAVKTIRTMPYPGFPTDAQAVVMAALTKAKGTSVVVENIFCSRYRHVDELVRMGADIKTEGKVAVVEGVKRLCGARVRACDLRGGAALVLAGLGAQGETEVEKVCYIDRGYENIEMFLRQAGADITRMTV